MNKMRQPWVFRLPPLLIAAALLLSGLGRLRAADGPGVPNITYAPERSGEILSIVDPGKAISTALLHRGYIFVPLGADHGGGQGAGAFAFYNVSNPSDPLTVFDSRSDNARYHTSSSIDYVGDWAEIHHLPVSGDLMLISERRNGSAGIAIFDTAPLYDNDPATKPRTISRMSFSGVTSPSNYDGYSFALGWQGRRYVYAPTGAQGLYIIDTTDLQNPVQAAHVSRSALGNVTLRAAWPIGNLLILAEGNVQGSFTATTFDIGNPTNPVALSTFSGPFGYHGFVYGGSYYGGGSPIARHDFSNPSNIVRTDLYQNPGFDRPEYGYGKDGALFIGHYPGATKWILNGNTVIPGGRVNSGLVDDHAFLNPLGNLILLCSDHNNNRKLMIGIHGSEADTIPPQPDFVSPANGATNQNILSRVGISFTDQVDPVSVNSSTFIVRKLSTGAQVAGTYSAMMGIVNFAPNAPLEANTTYDVYLAAGGVRDHAGNAVPEEVRVSRFSTGNTLLDYSTSVAPTTARQLGQTAQFTLNVNNPGGVQLEHSWDFGDGSPATPFGSSTTASRLYQSVGNFSVSVRTRIAGQTYAPFVSAVQVIHRAIAPTPPVSHSTIVFDPAQPLVWNVNKDNASVSAINTSTYARTYEISVGQKPTGLALGPGNTLWVVNQESASISVINRATGTVTATYSLPPGSAPRGIVISGSHAYVSLEGLGEIAKISTANGSVVSRLPVGPSARGLAIDPSRQRLWVSRFISPDQGGKLIPVNLSTFTAEPEVDLAPAMDADSLQNGRGIPNYLAAPVLSPDLSQGFVPSKKDNIYRGVRRDGLPLTFENSVRSMAACLDLQTGSESPSKRLDFDNSDIATAAVFSPLGNQVFFATSGSATIWVVDAYNPANRYSFQADGLAPDGLALNADGSRLYIHNFMDRTVTIFKTPVACSGVCGTAPRLAKVSTISTEALPPQVLRGKQLFYDTSDPRLAQEGYMSCASCHLDGGQDGRVWDFTNFGEGFRRTIDLKGRGVGHGPLHWSANFDEVQDFEGQIRTFAQGSGLMADSAFHLRTRAQPLGESKKGLSSDLDALAAYIQSLTTAGRSPHRNANGTLSTAALAGREIFRQENCASCHGGSTFTDSASLARHNVGTLSAQSGERLGGPLDGLDTPTLRGIWDSAPYLHDGSAATLRDVLVTRNPQSLHGNLADRSETEIQQLIAYLNAIDDLETDAPTNATGSAPALVSPGNRSNSIGQSISIQIASSGGTAPFTWSAMALPPGIVLNASTGNLSGAPSVVGTFTPTVAIRDSAGRSASVTFNWTVSDARARRFVRLVSLSSHNGGLFTSLADFTLFDLQGQPIDRSLWTVTASSQESSQNDYATNAIDAYPSTMWHTLWAGTAFPHHLTIDLGESSVIAGFTCLPRQDNNGNGRIKDYQSLWSDDGVNWSAPVASGTFPDNMSRQTVYLDRDGDTFSDFIENYLGTDVTNSASAPHSSYSGLAGWWRLNEASGSVADNVVGPDGALQGGPVRVAGVSGGALRLDGTTQSVRLASPDISTTSATFSAWVMRNGNQSAWAGILFIRSSTAAGLHFGEANELRYTWNDSQFAYHSGLTVPDGVWTYCAVVVEPGKATFYMKPAGAAMQTATRTATHASATFSGDWYLGQDSTGGRYFRGDIDEARFYRRSLSAAEITAVAAADNHPPVFVSDPVVLASATSGNAYTANLAGLASDPDAGDSVTFSKTGGPSWLNVAANGSLTGTPAAYNIGVNLFPIRIADSFGANTTATLRVNVIDPAHPDSDGDGFADALESALGTDPGSDVSQPSSIHAGLRGWWRFEEQSGSSAFDTNGNPARTGTLVGPPIRVTGSSGRGLDFNGTSQSVRVPALNQSSNTFTVAAWVRRNGDQSLWAGIAYAWQSGPASGMMFGPSNQLRYTWNGEQWDFDTGLTVPDGVWTFCAVVIESTKATIYLKPTGGPLQSSIRVAPHAAAPLAGDFYFAKDASASARHYKGRLDEIRLYSRSLSAAEIGELAEFTKPGPNLSAPATYALWRQINQLPAGPDGDPAAMPLNDGVSNLLKFALGLPASQRGLAGQFSAGTEFLGGAWRNTLTYRRPDPAPSGATYFPEVSGGLDQWSGQDLEVVSQTVADGVRTIIVRDTVPASSTNPNRFIRLRVTESAGQ